MTTTDHLADRLTGHQLRIVRLYLWHDATAARVAAALGCSLATLDYHRRQIRACVPECRTWDELLAQAQAEGIPLADRDETTTYST